MKKSISLIITAMLCVALLAACGGNAAPAGSTPASTAPSSTAPVSSAPASVAPSSTAPASVQAPASEEEYYNQDFALTNNTGVAIHELYVSPNHEDYWGEDLMGQDVIEQGETVHFSTKLVGTADALWDLKVVDEDGDEIYFPGMNLSSISTIDLHWGDGETPTADTDGAQGSVVGDLERYYSQDLDITNDTGVAIMELYVSPSSEEHWGEDLMGQEVFAAGDTFHFTTELLGNANATWDIRIIDEDGDEVVFTGVDFSATTALSLHWGEDGQTPTVTMK